MRVLLDANAFMMAYQFRVDIFTGINELIGSFQPITLPSVEKELKNLDKEIKSAEAKKAEIAKLEAKA